MAWVMLGDFEFSGAISAQKGLHSDLRELAHRHRKISESVASPLI